MNRFNWKIIYLSSLVLLSSGWGGLIQALTISEIMYAPLEQDLEFVEIYNEDVEGRELTGYYFARGITFVFENRTFIRGKSFLVVAVNPDKLISRYRYLAGQDPLFPKVVGPYS